MAVIKSRPRPPSYPCREQVLGLVYHILGVHRIVRQLQGVSLIRWANLSQVRPGSLRLATASLRVTLMPVLSLASAGGEPALRGAIEMVCVRLGGRLARPEPPCAPRWDRPV